MTVPSCVTHNNANSKADEYLKFLLSASAPGIPKAITRSTARSIIRLAKKRSGSLSRHGFWWDGEALVIGEDFPLDFDLLGACLKKVARALYFHYHCGRQKLLGELTVWPLFIPIDSSTAPELSSAVSLVRESTALDFDQLPRLGSHQEIFAYQVIEAPGIVVVNMEFYGKQRASVIGTAV